MASLQDFLSHITKNGIARSNRFQILIPLPSIMEQNGASVQNGSTLNNNSSARTLDIMCEQTEMPGKNITTTDIKYNGDFYKLPYATVYGVQNFIFKVDKNMREKDIIDEWMNNIYDPITHEVNYLDDFSVNITINKLDQQDNIVYSVILKDAFPTLCDPIIMSNEEVDAGIKLNTSFAYSGWVKASDFSPPTSGGGIGDLGGIVGEGNKLVNVPGIPGAFFITKEISEAIGVDIDKIVSPAIQKALEIFDKYTGINLTGEALAIYNQVNALVENATGNSINTYIATISSIRASTKNNNKLSESEKENLLILLDNIIDTMKEE